MQRKYTQIFSRRQSLDTSTSEQHLAEESKGSEVAIIEVFGNQDDQKQFLGETRGASCEDWSAAGGAYPRSQTSIKHTASVV